MHRREGTLGMAAVAISTIVNDFTPRKYISLYSVGDRLHVKDIPA
jgi:hypothetical protein